MIDVQINDWVAATYENTWLLLVKTTGFQVLFSMYSSTIPLIAYSQLMGIDPSLKLVRIRECKIAQDVGNGEEGD